MSQGEVSMVREVLDDYRYLGPSGANLLPILLFNRINTIAAREI